MSVGTVKKLLSALASPFVIGWGRTPAHWIWRRPASTIDEINIIVSKRIHPAWITGRHRRVARLVYWYMLLVWPIRAPLLIAKLLRKYGRSAKDKHGIQYPAQVKNLFQLAFMKQLNPDIYYIYELFSTERREQAHLYFSGNTISTLFSHINGYIEDKETEDKIYVAAFLKEAGFPTVPTLAVLDGQTAPSAIKEEIPERDFIAKPNGGMQGADIFRFEYLGSDRWLGSNAESYGRDDLAEFLLRQASRDTYLVQPRLRNHPDIQDLTTKGFSTVRMITGLRTDGSTSAIAAVFKMPTSDGVADNLAQGGIASPVDLISGKLGPALAKKLLSPRHDTHPDTGAQITGRELPCWEQLVSCAAGAHRTFGRYMFLGWDIGIDANGPVILETNVMWDAALIQRPHMSPLGATDFVAVCDDWLSETQTEG